MKCPKCGYDKFPLDNRNSKWDDKSKCQIRYRKCSKCGWKEKTTEAVEGPGGT